jgi:hypothetical protein
MVALGHGRDSIGIDIDSGNADLALEPVGSLFNSRSISQPSPRYSSGKIGSKSSG